MVVRDSDRLALTEEAAPSFTASGGSFAELAHTRPQPAVVQQPVAHMHLGGASQFVAPVQPSNGTGFAP